MTREEAIRTVYRLYDWLNGLSGTDTEITLGDIEQLFAPDAPMTLNNQRICHDHATHLKHARDLQANMATWRFNTPFERVVVEEDQVVGYYTADFVRRDGRVGRMYDLSIFTVRDGKIAGILENVFFEGEGFQIAAFG